MNQLVSSRYILHFGNGNITEECKKNLKVSFENDEHGNLVPIVTTKKFQYKGKLQDSLTNKMMVCNILNEGHSADLESVPLYIMHPQLPEDSPIFQAFKTKSGDKNFEFVENFGSSKMKSALRSARKKAQGVKAASESVKDAIKAEISQSDVEAMIQEQMASSDALDNVSECLPPQKIGAKSPNQLYDMQSLIPAKIQLTLNENSEHFYHWLVESFSTAEKSIGVPEFLKGCALTYMGLAVGQQAETECDKRVLTTMMFWYYMHQFYQVLKIHPYESKIKPLLPDMPPALRRHFSHMFFAKESNISGKMTLMKCVCHILVVSLYLYNWSNLDLTPLFSDLQLPPERLRSTLKAIGCYSVGEEGGVNLLDNSSRKRKLNLSANATCVSLSLPKKPRSSVIASADSKL